MLHLILILLSVLAAGVPMIGYLLLMRWLDRYEREPLTLVAAAFAWGAIGAIIIAIIAELLVMLPLEFSALSGNTAMFLQVSLVAPLIEEPAKALCLLLLYRSREFDNATDGFVYGAAAGLGFAMSENFIYFASVAGEGVAVWIIVVILRTLFSGLMHAAATSMVGAALGWAKFSTSPRRMAVVPLALLAAMGMHALWNGLAMAPIIEAGFALPIISFLLFPLEFLTLFVIFQASLRSESRLIRRELRAEARVGTLPSEHGPKIASWFARRKPSAWTPKGVNGEEYIKVATRLAFRRNQHAARPDDPFYAKEVERLRGDVRELLGDQAEAPAEA
jgi:RsiW-degrading membrane proteinase PrsW (M82 family)